MSIVHCRPLPRSHKLVDTPTLLLWSAVLATGLALAWLPLPWLLVAMPGVLLAGTALIKPQLALYALCFAIPFGSLFGRNAFRANLGGITVGITEGLIGLLFLSWAARAIAFQFVVGEKGKEERARGSTPRMETIRPLILFILATSLSLLNATSLPLAFKEMAKWVEFLGVSLYASSALTPRQSRMAVACLLLAGVAQAVLGAYQFFTRSGPEGFAFTSRFMRAYGTFEQPNPYGGYLGLTAPLAFALALSSLTRNPQPATPHPHTPTPPHPIPHWLRWLALGSFVAISTAVGMSGSRGAWMGFAAAFAVVNVARSRRGAIAFVTLVVVVALVGSLGGFRMLPASAALQTRFLGENGFVPGSIVQRLTNFLPLVGVQDISSIEVTDANYASLERLAFWRAALDMWNDHLWLGVGFGNYQAVYASYALPKWRISLGHAHNYYLNIAAETGLIGLLAYLALWGTTLWQVARAAHRSTSPYARALALGALGALTHVSVHNLVDNLWVHNMYIHVAIILGLVPFSLSLAGRQGASPSPEK